MTTEDRLTALFSQAPTRELVKALLTLDAHPPSPERNWSQAKTIEELERRFPSAGEAVGRAFDEAERRIVEDGVDEPVDYVAVLLANIPAN